MADFIRVKGSVVNVRQGPGTTFPVLFQAEHGEEFNLKKTEGLWCLVDLGDGKEAWVFARLVEILPGKAAGRTVSESSQENEGQGSGALEGVIQPTFILILVLFVLLVFWKRRRIMNHARTKLMEAAGYRREQPFRYDNRQPKDDSWEL